MLHVPRHPGDLDQVARLEGPLHAEEDACQEVLGDVAEGDADGQADQAGAADHRQGQLGQAGDSQNDVDAEEEDQHAHSPSHHITQ